MLRVTKAISCISLLLLLAASPAFSRVEASEKASRSRFTRMQEHGGIRLHYIDAGRGKNAIVFIHGWTCNANFWRFQIPEFAKEMRVIAVDLPGHGQSEKPQIPYTMDLFARSVAAVLKDAGVKKAVLAGHSMGAPVIWQFYRLFPENVSALVIFDGSLRKFESKEFEENLLKPMRGPEYRKVTEQFLSGMLGPHMSDDLRSEIRTQMLKTPQYVAVSAMDGMLEDRIWKKDRINVPVLAIMAVSPWWPPDNEEYYRSIAPDIDYKIMTDVGHFLMMEKPDEFNLILKNFLKNRQLT